MNGYTVKIIVAAHKRYPMPSDGMYLPLHVGAAGKLDSEGRPLDFGYARDDTGDNISLRNPSFCELTGLYWAWKNLKADYIGLAHYRRHFSMNGRPGLDGVLTLAELKPYLGKVRLFTPNRRRYFIESLYSHYAHTHYAEHLDETGRIIREMFPEYADSYARVLQRSYGYMFNMMIMDRRCLDAYCQWLFAILFELEKWICASDLPAFQQRLYGRVSEILFNVWLDYELSEKRLAPDQVMEIPVVFMEKVDWIKKITAFLKAKFTGKKYEKSF